MNFLKLQVKTYVLYILFIYLLVSVRWG